MDSSAEERLTFLRHGGDGTEGGVSNCASRIFRGSIRGS